MCMCVDYVKEKERGSECACVDYLKGRDRRTD